MRRGPLQVTCCQCGLTAAASIWNAENYDEFTVIESGPGTCEYCGHVRCEACQPDDRPTLADGCCECRKRVLSG
jgi:hypothetical protein